MYVKTQGVVHRGLWDFHVLPAQHERVTNPTFSLTVLEKQTRGGDSPVGERSWTLESIPSTIGHVLSGRNLGGPPSKAK